MSTCYKNILEYKRNNFILYLLSYVMVYILMLFIENQYRDKKLNKQLVHVEMKNTFP